MTTPDPDSAPAATGPASSEADTAITGGPDGPAPPEPVPAAPVTDPLSLRLLGSELRLIATRRRNLVGLAVLCAIPVVLAVVLALSDSAERSGTAQAPPFVSLMFGNGLLVVTGTFSVECLVFLPSAVSMLSADSISGEADTGTLRYLLTVPIGRTRLLMVKFTAAAIATVTTVAAIAVVGAVTGIALFGTGDLVTLSGSTIPFEESLWRVGLMCLYIMAMMVAFLAVAMFAASLTDQPAAAVVGCLLYVLVDQLLVTTPDLAWLNPYLFTGYWRDWGDLLRQPIETGKVVDGLLVAGVYAAMFGSATWARLTTKDVTS